MVHLRAAFVCLILLTTVLVANAIQMATVVVRPFSERLFRTMNVNLAGNWWQLFARIQTKLLRIEFIFSGDPLPFGENAIVVSNHQKDTDIPALMPLAERSGMLFHMKWFAKQSLKWVPGIGWGMHFLDCIFLARNWHADASRIERTFRRLNSLPIPFWLISFPEGTRITPAKLEKTRAYARRKGLPEPQNTLVPRTKGFTVSVLGLKRAQAVYDVTIAYPGGVPSFWRYLGGSVRQVHIQARRFPIEALPKDEATLSDWLLERFRAKDALLERFKATGTLT